MDFRSIFRVFTVGVFVSSLKFMGYLGPVIAKYTKNITTWFLSLPVVVKIGNVAAGSGGDGAECA